MADKDSLPRRERSASTNASLQAAALPIEVTNTHNFSEAILSDNNDLGAGEAFDTSIEFEYYDKAFTESVSISKKPKKSTEDELLSFPSNDIQISEKERALRTLHPTIPVRPRFLSFSAELPE